MAWWGILVICLIFAPFAWGAAGAFLDSRPDKHQACLKRIYEMEQGMPELEGIPWVYPEGRGKALHQSRWTYLSWEDFPLEVYEKQNDKAVEKELQNYTQVIGHHGATVQKATAEDAARHGVPAEGAYGISPNVVVTESGNYIDKAYAEEPAPYKPLHSTCSYGNYSWRQGMVARGLETSALMKQRQEEHKKNVQAALQAMAPQEYL